MTSVLDMGMIRTAAVEKVVAPIACHLCRLVLLCDTGEDPDAFSQLEVPAQAVAEATENLSAVASRHTEATEDEVLHIEMSSLLESVSVSGQHVLLAAQKLTIQPSVPQHREELIAATQNVFLSVVRVLLVHDDAAIRRVTDAADEVVKSLSQLGSSTDIKSLLESFRVFSAALLHLNQLTIERGVSLQDPTQTEVLFDSLKTLKRCISMLHTAMCTTIKHPGSEPAQAAKRYILDRVQSTVSDIVGTLKSDSCRVTVGAGGFYTERRESLLQLLSNSSQSSMLDSGFDSLVRDLVIHCMLVANCSRSHFQEQVVSHCRHILQFWSELKSLLLSTDDVDVPQQSFELTCTLMIQQIQELDDAMSKAVLYQVLDTFLPSTVTTGLKHAVDMVLVEESPTKVDLSDVQPLVEDFISLIDSMIQVAGFISASAADAKSLENLENSRASLSRIRASLDPLSLELADDSLQTVEKLHAVIRKWEEEVSQLQDALCDALNVRELSSVGISEIAVDRRGCDTAYREQNYNLFKEHAENLQSHMKQVIHSVRRHLDSSDNPIYRNGLLVLLKQVMSSQTKVSQSVQDMLIGSRLNVDAYSTFTHDVSAVIAHFKVLRQGLDGQQHPHLLSPLRREARQLDEPSACSHVKDTCEINQDELLTLSLPPVSEAVDPGLQARCAKERSDEETLEVELAHRLAVDDLSTAVFDEPKMIRKPLAFDLLPLLYEVVTMTKGKNVTALNQACTGVLELSNCYVQAAKEATVVVDAVDCQTLENFRSELMSLTPTLVQAAQETAMSPASSTESIYKYSTQFSDLVNNIRKLLVPVAGSWYHTAFSELQASLQTTKATVSQQLNEVMQLCADVVQLLMMSDFASHADNHEPLSALHNKLNKTQNNTKKLIELSASFKGQMDQLQGLCILWGLSVQTLLNSLDTILGTSHMVKHRNPKKLLSVLSENSLRVQEAVRLTTESCRSAYRSKQLTEHRTELQTLTDVYFEAVEKLDIMPSVVTLAKSEFTQRHILIKIRVLLGILSKENKDYVTALQNVVNIAYSAAENYRESDTEEAAAQFETAAQALEENFKSAAKSVECCLNYIRDPRVRSNLRSITTHLSIQISEIISRARLMVLTHYICDTLSLDVHIQGWCAEAHFVEQEIRKQDGIHQEAKDQIKAGLQGRSPEGAAVIMVPTNVQEMEFSPPHSKTLAVKEDLGYHPSSPEPEEKSVTKYQQGKIIKHESGYKGDSSLSYTSMFLQRESNTWDPKGNTIVQVTRKMADTICHMTQYLRKRGPILNKQAFVTAAKDLISHSQSVTQFLRVISNHSLDKQCTVELSLILEQILTVTNQLCIISSVNSVTPGCKSSDEILVKNAQNLLQTVLRGVRAAETACITGLKQPDPNSDDAEATALCFQWRRDLEIHRAQQSFNPDTDDLGLRKISSNTLAPSLATLVNA